MVSRKPPGIYHAGWPAGPVAKGCVACGKAAAGASGGWARKGKFRHIRRRLACRIAGSAGRRDRRRSGRARKVRGASGRRTRSVEAVPMLDSARAAAKLAPDVTDRPGGRAGEREFAEGSRCNACAAPATVTGEPRPNHATVPSVVEVREGGARWRSGSQETWPRRSFGAGRGAPEASGEARQEPWERRSRHERRVRSWRELCAVRYCSV
jgi:hypothetical protein